MCLPVTCFGDASYTCIFLVWGEVDGYDAGNNDRTILSRGNEDSHSPSGLACYARISQTYLRDIVPEALDADRPPDSIGGGYGVSIWVRTL